MLGFLQVRWGPWFLSIEILRFAPTTVRAAGANTLSKLLKKALLFSESSTRFLVEVTPDREEAFRQASHRELERVEGVGAVQIAPLHVQQPGRRTD